MAWRKRGLTNRGSSRGTRLNPQRMDGRAGGNKTTLKHNTWRNIGNKELCNLFLFHPTLGPCGMLLFTYILVGLLAEHDQFLYRLLSVLLFYSPLFYCCTYIFLLFFHYDFLILVD